MAVYLGLPLLALIWRAGVQVNPPGWSIRVVWRSLELARAAEGHILVGNLVAVLYAGILAAGLALLACWAALDSRVFRLGVLALMALAWAWPGPVVGLGLKAVLGAVVESTNSALLDRLLWRGPLLPLIWVDVIRFFPCAVALLWPVVRLLPPDLRDAARVDGARPWQELFWVLGPLTAVAGCRAALAVAVLSLGELSAGKVLSVPGMPSYAQNVFAQMHYGVTNYLAGCCLQLLLVVGAGAAGFGLWQTWASRGQQS